MRRGWRWLGRDVSCAEFAAAMYAAGQDRLEVKRRLLAMERWPLEVVVRALVRVEGRLELDFERCGWGSSRGYVSARSIQQRRVARERKRPLRRARGGMVRLPHFEAALRGAGL